MSLEDLLALLNHTPVVSDIHPVSMCYLPEDITVFNSVDDAIWLLDDPEPTLPRRLLIASSATPHGDRFPHFHCNHDPFTPALNQILFDRYDQIASCMLCQNQIPERIIADAPHNDLIILLLIDGLSYQDVCNWTHLADRTLDIEPCLVNVPSLTHVAFPNLIGSPSVAARLFDIGYYNRFGFTYWTREDNQLTDQLFKTIAYVEKAGRFPQILMSLRSYLEGVEQDKIYVQIVRTGLDGYAHGQKRKPPVSAIVKDILREFERLVKVCEELCNKQSLRACLYLTSDHGVLWCDEFEPQVIGSAPGKSSPRWCTWRDLYHQRDKGRRFVINNEEYYCLDFPKLRRPLHIDEQGIHGGISFQESVVPFIKVRIGG